MNIRTLISTILLGILFAACNGESSSTRENNGAQDPAAEKWESIMAVHDEVMPKMSSINQISRKLRAYAEQHPDMPAERREEIESTVQQLSEAEEGMMKWMSQAPSQYKKLREEKSEEALMQFLEEQEAVIKKVRANMLQAIDDGKALLSTLQPDQKEQ